MKIEAKTTRDARRGAETLELPDVEAMASPSTTAGAKPIFFRFIVVAVSINALFGLALVLFDIKDSLRQDRDLLASHGAQIATTCAKIHAISPDLSSARVIDRCATLTGTPLALVDAQTGKLLHASTPSIAKALPKVYGPGHTPHLGVEVAIRKELGELSGAWILRPFADARLLLVERRSPEDLGYFQYLTVGAGVVAAGLLLSIIIMLASARWVLYQPVQRLVDRLTGALARDIERRRAAEARAILARAEAEKHLAFQDNLLDASQAMGIIGTDREGIVRLYNRAAEQILGYGAAEVSGEMTLDALHDRCRRDTESEQRVPLRSLIHVGPNEEFAVDKAGRERVLALTEANILDRDGQRTGQLLIFSDITKRKRLEAEVQLNETQLIQSAKMASLGEMATGVAHELNQPLNNIGLLASRLRRRLTRGGDHDDETRTFFQEKLERIQGQVERASRIIDELRTFGRHGGQSSLQPVPITEPVAHVQEMLAEQLRSAGVQLVIDLPSDLPPILGDEGQLEQVLLNLIVNARDAFEDEGTLGEDKETRSENKPEIRVTARHVKSDSEDTRVKLIVSDNGPGMSKETRARAFQPFFTTKEVGRGTGLGLAITYGLIRGFGGTVALDSNLGEGTTFTLSLRPATSIAVAPESPGASEEDHVEG